MVRYFMISVSSTHHRNQVQHAFYDEEDEAYGVEDSNNYQVSIDNQTHILSLSVLISSSIIYHLILSQFSLSILQNSNRSDLVAGFNFEEQTSSSALK
ncbi:hypothetical protein L1887_17137 [Cichorium endivia]|nr:hypothetical protein L1887_17137 [Cichorium endivia]